jgi:NAD(P)H-flavin reductase
MQRLAQGAFLAAEGLFNRLFGEKSNPFYYLGAIAYYQLWVVVASGLYLYIFFETSVTEAYSSVEAITHSQRWAGGVMRSLHRYASDGMVLAMLLHLARHFVFGHHRGFRWFSWVSGVALLVLVYATGINGYMLPWDQLAQFVVTATTEWLDYLPIFNGTLARNFLYATSVNDRFFSLLSFLHIGLPLGVLALLWIHTQRVPKAHTQPPMGITVGVSVMLLGLSLAMPAASHAPADLATVPQSLALDWFYLPVYPLIYQWGIAATWLLVAGAMLVMVMLPWLPPRFRRGPAEFAISVHPDERIVTARPGETILEAGLREGLPMPFDCRNGGCGVCKGKVLEGAFVMEPYQASVLTAEERADGKTLFCCAVPQGDLEIEYQPLPGAKASPVRQYGGRVMSMERLTHDVMKVMLRVEDGGKLRWHAGQYINIFLKEGGQKRSFSFATAPGAGPADMIELHIRHIPGGLFTTHVFEGMKVGEFLRFEGPLGAFHLREEGTKPIIFVAGSTGFAPVKSMLEHAFATGLKRRMILYWGVRRPRDLYARELAEEWARKHENFSFIPVLSEPRTEDEWSGRTGLVHQAIMADYPDLSKHQIYACGSVQMVEAVMPALATHGLSPDDCFSDAFRINPYVKGEETELVRLGGGA